ncbi:MAG: hypothetical protein GF334_13400 [Candidatus Altiarchaeales archaeon]|nr:hypothetical protein [Candidatus Altiarchaeales archaeon]
MPGKQLHTAITLSGVEGDRFYDTAYEFAQCRNMLMSFMYMGEKGDHWFQKRVKRHPDVRWLIDSGAHTFRTEAAEYHKQFPNGNPDKGVDERYHPKFPNLQWFEDYVRRYRDWLISNKELINLAVNLDIDNIVGLDKQREWDNDIFRPLERAGVPICYVWHESWGYDYWLQMCREHEYVGLPGNLSESDYHRMLKPAIMNGCRVHGFALTKAFVIGRMAFASLDSISWKAGEMYGQTFVWEGSKLRVYDKKQKDQRKRFKSRWIQEGVDWSLLEQDKAEAITQVNAIAWKDYIQYCENRSSRLAYWIKATKAFDDLGDPDNLSGVEMQAFFEQYKFPYKVESESAARQDLKEMRAFCERDPETVFSLDDARIDYWIETFQLTPESDSRPEREATIRDFLYKYFYDISAAQARPRKTKEDLDPNKRYQEREELPPHAAAVEVELDLASGHRYQEGAFFVCLGSKTNVEGNASDGQRDASSEASNPQVEDFDFGSEVEPDTGFTSDLEDRVLRTEATLGVELLFEQLKLRHEADFLKSQKRRVRYQRTLRSKARRLSDRISEIFNKLPETLAEKGRQAAEDAYQQWSRLQDPEQQKQALKAKEIALRPQNRLTPEQARAMGKRGGAPKGNQNARKHGLYSTRMPNLACDNCPHMQVCPQYKQGFVCSYLNEFNQAIEASEGEEPEQSAVQLILIEQIKRARRALLFETFEGGIANKECSRILRDVQSAAQLLHQMKNPVVPPGRDDTGSEATKKSDSPLSRIFGDLGKRPKDAEFSEVETSEDQPQE